MMHRNDKISVIIPVYNVESYIRRCIESVIHQSYTNIEIILVDDGSTDNSGEICDGYKNLDDRICVIHKENRGLSDARNVGIVHASGKYITFIDSDDYVTRQYIQYLYRLIKKYDADIAICDYMKSYSDNDIPCKNVNYKEICFDTKTGLLNLLYQKIYTSSAWAKLYNKHLFDDILFPVGELHEDVAIMYKLFRKAKKVAYCNMKMYLYYQRQGSIVNSAFNAKRMDYVKHTKKCMAQMRKSRELYNAAVSRHYSACFELICQIEDEKRYKKECDILKHEIKKYSGIVWRDHYARKINRIAAMITSINYKAAVVLCKCFIKVRSR